jgi:hypothetical protein
MTHQGSYITKTNPRPLALSDNLTSSVQVFKHAKRLGYGEHDVSAVYIRARF